MRRTTMLVTLVTSAVLALSSCRGDTTGTVRGLQHVTTTPGVGTEVSYEQGEDAASYGAEPVLSSQQGVWYAMAGEVVVTAGFDRVRRRSVVEAVVGRTGDVLWTTVLRAGDVLVGSPTVDVGARLVYNIVEEVTLDSDVSMDAEYEHELVVLDLESGELQKTQVPFERPFERMFDVEISVVDGILLIGGSLLTSGSFSPRTAAFDVESGEILWNADAHFEGIADSTVIVATGPDRRRLAGHDLRTGTQKWEIDTDGYFVVSEEYVLATGPGEEDPTAVFDATNGQPVVTLTAQYEDCGLGEKVAACSYYNEDDQGMRVVLLDLPSGEARWNTEVDAASDVTGVSGKRVYVSNGEATDGAVLDLATGDRVTTAGPDHLNLFGNGYAVRIGRGIDDPQPENGFTIYGAAS